MIWQQTRSAGGESFVNRVTKKKKSILSILTEAVRWYQQSLLSCVFQRLEVITVELSAVTQHWHSPASLMLFREKLRGIRLLIRC